ncbi:ABC transporter permease [Plantactinospora solaniradicis]|uniref:ABC transporter permease n=1 Tax=Plantactinospora solaniradicis TaxID=1723736 RepID=A0ABW1KS43_9ACTN
MTGELVGSWRTAVRIARRSAARNRGRSVLILLMLLLPAYAATLLVVAWANVASLGRDLDFQIGAADVVLSAEPAELRRVVATLPAGSRTVPHAVGRTVVALPSGGLAGHEYEATDPTDPLNRGRYVLRAGTAPRGAAEVALSSAMAARLGAGIGDQIEAGMPQRRLTVVGIIDLSRSLKLAALVVPPDVALSAGASRSLLVDVAGDPSVWIRPPVGPGEITHHGDGSWSEAGQSYTATDRQSLSPPAAYRATQAAATALVVSFAAAQVVLLTGAAFLVGARRQRRELALIAAVGGNPRQVGRVVLAGGLVLGAVAAGIGSALGLATFALVGPTIERVADHPIIDVSVPGWSVAGVAAATIAIGLVAAYLPARTAGRGPLRAALGGLRTRSRADLGWLGLGLVLLTGGTVTLFQAARPDGRTELIVAGGVALLLGVTAGTPALVRAIGRTAWLLPLSGRLALRHAARHHLRTAAAVAAVSAAVAGSVALTLVGAARGEAAQAWRDARDGQVLLPAEAAAVLGPDGIGRLADALPARSAVALRTAVDPTRPGTRWAHPEVMVEQLTGAAAAAADQVGIAVGGAETIRAVTGRDATTAELDALRNGAAVAFNDRLVVDGQVAGAIGDDGPKLLPAVVAVRGEYFRELPGVLVSEATARRLGLTPTAGHLLVDTTRTPRPDELAAATTILLRAQLAAEPVRGAPFTVEPAAVRVAGTDPRTMFYVLAVVSAVVTVAASLVAVGLAGSEMRDDLSTMTAVGAAPGVRRRITAAQAAVVVGLGAPLGLLAGIGPAAGYVAFDAGADWQTPWGRLLLVVAVPAALATLLAATFVRTRPGLARRAG